MLSVWLSLAKGFPKHQPHHLFSGMEWVPNASFGGILHHPSSYDCSPSWISRWTGNNSNEDPASGKKATPFFANPRTFPILFRAWNPLLKWFSDQLLSFPLPIVQLPCIKPGPWSQGLLCDSKPLRIFGGTAWPRWIQITYQAGAIHVLGCGKMLEIPLILPIQ